MQTKPIYPIEEWSITETSFDMASVYRNETTFALSNGYIGTRGTFEEGYPFTEKEGLEGNFINGFYESESIRYGEWNFGFPTSSQSLLNLPNLKTTRLLLDGELFDMRIGTVEEYRRCLHMDTGLVERSLIWTSPAGKKVRIDTQRLVSLKRKNIMTQRYSVTALNFTGKISFVSRLDAEVENHTRTTNPLVDYGPFGRHLIKEKLTAQDGVLFYQGTTQNSGLTMACASLHTFPDNHSVKSAVIDNDSAEIEYTADIQEAQTLHLDKFMAYTSMLDMPKEQLEGFILQIVQEAAGLGFDFLAAEQKEAFKAYWDIADIQIRTDRFLQQGIRFNLFHIMQAAGRDGKTGMGAKGLSGEGYEGHYFWDTEMYVLPVFIYTDPALAKSLLDYRYHTLGQARDRARILGHPTGALFPWRTINGSEASTYYPLGTAQYHINADIAYAFKFYIDVTGDTDYLISHGAEVLVETARVWADVGCFAESKNNQYCICAVTGPDEYNAIVDNNFYTNLMARENIRDALWALRTMQDENQDAYAKFVQRLSISPDETEYWQKIVDNMYFPYDEKRQVYPLDDGFMMRKPWDDSKIPPEKRHLLYENYHPLFIFRQKMSKQADAILGMMLHSHYFSTEELKRNYDFYQEVTLHHSSLSTCIFGILASRIGYGEEAYRYFSQSARMDLDDSHNNFYAGIHAANMAGTWQAIVFGFAGVRIAEGRLEFHINLPKEWQGFTFKLNFRGSILKINSDNSGCVFTLENQKPVTFYLDGKEILLTKKGEQYEQTI